MKIGILGTGFGAYHVEVYKNISDSNTIKIYGRNTEKLASLGEKLRIETTNDIESIITDKNIDLVDVCLPSSIHKKYVIEALKNGKDVFCETPAALNMEDASQMLTASKKYGGRVFVDNFIKFDAPYKYLYDTINNNSLGKLNVLHMKRKTPPFWGSLGFDRIATDLMIHDFDYISMLFGEPDNISVHGIEPASGLSHVEALLTYDNTAVSIEGSSLMPYSYPFTTSYEADFENGTIEFSKQQSSVKTETSLKLFTKDKCKPIEIKEENCYELAFKDVLNSCQNNQSSILSLENAVKSLKTALKVKNDLSLLK